MYFNEWLGCRSIQGRRTPSFSAGVELIDVAPRAEPERVFGVWFFFRRPVIGRFEPRLSPGIIRSISLRRNVSARFDVMPEIPTLLIAGWKAKLRIQLLFTFRKFFVAGPADATLCAQLRIAEARVIAGHAGGAFLPRFEAFFRRGPFDERLA